MVQPGGGGGQQNPPGRVSHATTPRLHHAPRRQEPVPLQHRACATPAGPVPRPLHLRHLAAVLCPLCIRTHCTTRPLHTLHGLCTLTTRPLHTLHGLCTLTTRPLHTYTHTHTHTHTPHNTHPPHQSPVPVLELECPSPARRCLLTIAIKVAVVFYEYCSVSHVQELVLFNLCSNNECFIK